MSIANKKFNNVQLFKENPIQSGSFFSIFIHSLVKHKKKPLESAKNGEKLSNSITRHGYILSDFFSQQLLFLVLLNSICNVAALHLKERKKSNANNAVS